jgi:hypothetical protein
MASQTKKISKKDRAAIIENFRALEGMPRSLDLYKFILLAGIGEVAFTTKVAAADGAEAEKILRQKYDVRRLDSVEFLGYVTVPA